MKKKRLRWSKSDRETIQLLTVEVGETYRVDTKLREISVPYSEVEKAIKMQQVHDLCNTYKFHIQTAIA